MQLPNNVQDIINKIFKIIISYGNIPRIPTKITQEKVELSTSLSNRGICQVISSEVNTTILVSFTNLFKESGIKEG